jgi:PIN domain nuclease of toxin-antitoxin system
VKYLLDTHALLWFADGDPQLSAKATKVLLDPTNELFLSMASIWELAIKVGLGKLTLSTNYRDYVSRAIKGYGITILDITFDDCVRYEALPFPNAKHRDPYDRMIVVQAQRQSLSLISIDDKLDGYGVARIW